MTPPPSPSLLPGPGTGTPSTGKTPAKQADGPSASESSNSGRTKKFLTTKRVVWISIAGVLSFIILILALVLFMPRCIRQRRGADSVSKRHQIGADGDRENPPRDNGSLVQPTNQMQKGKQVSLNFFVFLMD